MSKRLPPQDNCAHLGPVKDGLKVGNWFEIVRSAKKCLTALLKCQKCGSHPTYYGVNKEHSWALNLHCIECSKTFSVCTLCPLNKKQFATSRDIVEHTRTLSHKTNFKNFLLHQDRQSKAYLDKIEFNPVNKK